MKRITFKAWMLMASMFFAIGNVPASGSQLLKLEEEEIASPELSVLTPSVGVLIPEFDSEILFYQMNLSPGSETISFNASSDDPGATVEIPDELTLADGTDYTVKIPVTVDEVVTEYQVSIHVQSENEVLYLSAGNTDVIAQGLEQDLLILDHLKNQGYSVTYIERFGIDPNRNDFEEFDYSPYMAMVISPSVRSDATAWFRVDEFPLPVVTMQKDAPKANRWIMAEVANLEEIQTANADHLIMNILNDNHYITYPFGAGDEVVWTTYDAGNVVMAAYNFSNSIPNAVPLTGYKGSTANFYNGYAIDAGSVIEGLTLDHRMVVLASHTEAMKNPTNDMLLFVSRSLDWVLEADKASMDLSSLISSVGQISPAFNPERNAYQLVVPKGTQLVEFTAASLNPEASIDYPDAVSLSDGDNVVLSIDVKVGDQVNTYDVHVHVQTDEEILYLGAGTYGVLAEELVQDQQIIELLQENGYSVSYIERFGIDPTRNDFDAFDYSPYTALVVSPSVRSDATAWFRTDEFPIPVLTMQKDAPKANRWIMTDLIEEPQSNDPENKKMLILNGDHYITSSFDAGDELVWTTYEERNVVLAAYDFSASIPNAVALTTYKGSTANFANGYAIEIGTVIEGLTLAHRMVLLASHTEAMIEPTEVMDELIIKSLEWILGANLDETSIGDLNDNGSNVLVYPTVSGGQFTVEFSNQPGMVTVYDISGRIVSRSQAVSAKEIINIAQSGVYLIEVESQNQTQMFKVFVK